MSISQWLRPEEPIRFLSSHHGIAALAGLQLESGFTVIDDLILMRCNRAEWETFETSWFFQDWYSEYDQANPVFLYHPVARPQELVVTALLEQLAQDGARLITACRLYKLGGALLEPVLTMRAVCCRSELAAVHRASGPYRSEYIALPLDQPSWMLPADEEAQLAILCASLRQLQPSPEAERLAAILAQFNLSHLPSISLEFSIHVLFTGLEMLFEAVVHGLEFHSDRYQRALAAVLWATGNQLPEAMCYFNAERLRELRNAAQHHALRRISMDLSAGRALLQLMLACGIRLHLAMLLPQAMATLAELRASTGWQSLSHQALLNAALDQQIQGHGEPLASLTSLWI